VTVSCFYDILKPKPCWRIDFMTSIPDLFIFGIYDCDTPVAGVVVTMVNFYNFLLFDGM